jgi:hypothetical protein
MTEDFNADNLREVPASEILSKIKNGELVKYDNIRIIGNVDINNLNLPLKDGKLLVVSVIEIISSTFEGIVNFSNGDFQNYINFSKTKFNRSVSFCGSVFSVNVNFISSRFGESAHFYLSNFDGRVIFSSAQFRGLATFYDSIFKDEANFFRSRFNGDVTFKGSEFLKVSDFSGSKFDEKAIFESSKFKRDAIFRMCSFGRFTNFRSCFFGKNLDLTGSNISTIFLQDAIFEKDSFVLLKHSEFSRLEIPWSLVRHKLEYDGSVYLALIRNYNNLEWFDDADECIYQYRTIRRKEHLHGSKKFIDTIPWLFYGYGVRFYYPLAWMIVVYAASAIIYLWLGQIHFSDAFALSTIILTTTTQVGNLAGLSWYMSIVERILGWLLMSTFLVALAKKTLR